MGHPGGFGVRLALALLACLSTLAGGGCSGNIGPGNGLLAWMPPDTEGDAGTGSPPIDTTPDDPPDAGAPTTADLATTPLAVGGSGRVTASSLNLRSGAGTMNSV